MIHQKSTLPAYTVAHYANPNRVEWSYHDSVNQAQEAVKAHNLQPDIIGEAHVVWGPPPQALFPAINSGDTIKIVEKKHRG